MNWESILGPSVIIALAALGGFGGYMTLRGTLQAESRETARRFAEGDTDRKDLRSKLEALDRNSVRRDELRELKTEIVERVKEAEHTIRGSQAIAIAEMRDMVKTLLDRALNTLGSRA